MTFQIQKSYKNANIYEDEHLNLWVVGSEQYSLLLIPFRYCNCIWFVDAIIADHPKPITNPTSKDANNF